MPKILIVTGDAAESLEVMYPYQRLLEEGYEVDIAAPSVKKLQFVVHDFTDGFDTYTEKPGYTWPADIAFADVNPADYVALVIPGGRAPEYLRMNAKVIELVQHFARAGKPIASICHGAQILAAAGVIRGKRVSAYPACAAEVKLAGAEYAAIAMDQAVTDGTLVTAPAWPAHPAWLAQFLAVLGTRIAA
jgi:protease I